MRKLFKKSLACCLALALCFTLFAGAISANALTTNPSYSTEDVTVAPGESTTIKFTIKDFAEIQGVILKVYVPSVVASIDAVTVDGIDLVEWDDEEGSGNYQIGADATGKYVKFMTLANIDGINTDIAALTFDIDVTVAADAAPGAASYPAPVIQATDGDVLVAINGEFAQFVVEEVVVEDGIKTFTTINRQASLEIKGLIQIRQYYAFEIEGLNMANKADKTYVVENGGLLVWNAKNPIPENYDEAIVGTAAYSVPLVDGGTYKGFHEFYAVTEGIPAAEYVDNLYYRPYVLIDGEYQYGDVYEYGVKTYCVGRFKAANATVKLKNALVTLLNYGAAAQVNFNYKADTLVNADLQDYVDQGYITATDFAYEDSYINEIVAPDSDMTVNFPANKLKDNGNSCILQGAISLNQYFGIDASIGKNVASKTMYVWTAAKYAELKAAGTPLSKENASYTVEAGDVSYSSKYGYECSAATEQIPAAEIGNTVYLALGLTGTDGTEYTSTVFAHSPEEYAAGRIKANNNPKLVSLVKAMVVYSEFMQINFAK